MKTTENVTNNHTLTAVEWLSIELQKVMGTDIFYYSIKEQVEQAQQMEKEQIVCAWNDSKVSMMNGDQYYNETYNK
jgi:hypothetical protein